MRTSFLLIGLVLMPALHVRADLPAIRFDQMQPLGGSAGSTIEVEIKGADIEGVQHLVFDQPGLTAEPIPEKERFFRITVAPEVPVGTYDVYLSGRFGVSNSRLLAVSKGLTEVLDNGQNRSRETAQSISLNSAVNGMVDGNAEDFYRLTLTTGQRITADCFAQRLDVDMDLVLTLMTAEGKPLATSSDYYGQDPFLDFVAPTAGDYLLGLHDLSYRGGQPYRLVVSDLPHVENVYPAAVQVGQAATFAALGRNLQRLGGATSNWASDRGPLDQLTFTWQPPDVLPLGEYTFRDHPTHHSVAATAATCTLIGTQVLVPGVESVGSFPPVLVTADPVTLEQENPNDGFAPQQLTLPVVLAGRFEQPRDADWFEFRATESGQHNFNVYCERIAGRADPYLVLLDDKGNRLNELDDFGHRINAFDGHLRDPSQEINLEKDRLYKVLVQDRYGRGGFRTQYVLEIRRSIDEMYVSAMHRSNPNPGGTTVFKGTATYVDVIVHHRGDTNSGIKIEAEQLPPGLHLTPTFITNNTYGPLVLWAEADAPEWTGPISLIATYEREGQVVRRRVRPHARVFNNSGTSLPQRQLLVAVREQGPFQLRLEPAEIQVTAGQAAELTLHLTRHWSDFTGPVAIQPHQFQGNFQLGNFEIPADATSAPVKIAVQAGTRPGKYTLTVIGQGQVPFNKDAAATDKPKTLVSTPSQPVTLTVIAAEKP